MHEVEAGLETPRGMRTVAVRVYDVCHYMHSSLGVRETFHPDGGEVHFVLFWPF